MKLRTQFISNMVLFGATLLVIAGSVIYTYQRLERVNRRAEIVQYLEQGAGELGYLANDYLLYHESQQRARLESRLSMFADYLSRLDPGSPEQEAIVRQIRAGERRLKAVFAEVVSTMEDPLPTRNVEIEQALLKISWSRLQVQVQGLAFDASRLSEMLNEQADRLKLLDFALIFSLIGAFVTYFLTNYLLLYRRTIRSIALLQEGTGVIGAGNLDFRIEEQADDEIGRLSRAFNRMTASLKEVTASKAALEREIAERAKAEREREITVEFLRLVNESQGERELVEAAILFFQRRSGCEAVGVRLRDGENYPYFQAQGFPPHFIQAENSLRERGGAGEPGRDQAGNPVLACMCGNVIRGRFDPARPFFTPAGSFWTNSTAELPASTGEEDRLAHTRSRCREEGYESAALIPLRLGSARLGLLQLSDRRKGLFSAESIALWEKLAGYLAVALARFHTEQALQELNATLEERVAERTALAENRSRQLQALAVQLTEAEERERRRVAGLLHDDLQQILASARLQLQVARQALPPSPILAGVEDLLEESLRKSRRLTHELSPAILQHAGLVASLGWLARQTREQFGLEVELEAGEVGEQEGPLKVLLFRSVQELLFNVVKHSGVGNARVRLSSLNGQLAVTVCDPGRGFDPAILEPACGTAAGAAQSPAGIGLMSIRERIQAVGGSMAIESAPGAGSCIQLTVPLAPAKSAAVEKRALSGRGLNRAPEPLSGAAGSGGYRVLLVDDHKVMRQGLIAMIDGQPDIQVVGEAANGREAIELARELEPNVILMDVSMPEMNGIEATRRIKAEMPGVRVIGLSMFEEESIARAMREAGAEAFLCKTNSSASLLKAIYRLPGRA